MKQLPIPPAAEQDARSVEMIRAWIAERGLHCSLNVGMWHELQQVDERRAWGILLADVARHVSNALQEDSGLDRRDSLRVIRECFEEELSRPTSRHRGGFVEQEPE